MRDETFDGAARVSGPQGDEPMGNLAPALVRQIGYEAIETLGDLDR